MAGDPEASVPLTDLAKEERLFVHSIFTAPGATFPFGTHVAVAEVDTETGKPTLTRVITVDDAGVVLNPLLAEGQRHGGIAQGAAQALLEEFVYDADGNPLTASFADYPIVSATELPSFELASMETPTSYNPLGAKGIGEAGTIGATPAVQNAIVDAVAHLGVRHVEMPATAMRVWRAIQSANSAQAQQEPTATEKCMMQVKLTVNGEQRSDEVEPRLLLVHYLREVCGLRAANVGCDTTSCGACTVLLDGESVKSCTVLAAQAAGQQVVTAEGLAAGRRAAPGAAGVQERARPAVRLLHAWHGDGRGQPAEGEPGPDRGRRFARASRATFAGAPATTTSSAPCSLPRAQTPGRGDRMIPAQFDYVAADSAAHAIELLGQHGDDAKVLAGGHSLLPMMKLRLAAPAVLIDISPCLRLVGNQPRR